MSAGSKRSKGFTLVEIVVSVVLIGVGITAIFGALSAMDASYFRAREKERMQRLAVNKYEELIATREWEQAPLSGAFEGTDYTWTAESVTSGIENLMTLTITVRGQRVDAQPLEIVGVVFNPPLNGGAVIQ